MTIEAISFDSPQAPLSAFLPKDTSGLAPLAIPHEFFVRSEVEEGDYAVPREAPTDQAISRFRRAMEEPERKVDPMSAAIASIAVNFLPPTAKIEASDKPQTKVVQTIVGNPFRRAEIVSPYQVVEPVSPYQVVDNVEPSRPVVIDAPEKAVASNPPAQVVVATSEKVAVVPDKAVATSGNPVAEVELQPPTVAAPVVEPPKTEMVQPIVVDSTQRTDGNAQSPTVEASAPRQVAETVAPSQSAAIDVPEKAVAGNPPAQVVAVDVPEKADAGNPPAQVVVFAPAKAVAEVEAQPTAVAAPVPEQQAAVAQSVVGESVQRTEVSASRQSVEETGPGKKVDEPALVDARPVAHTQFAQPPVAADKISLDGVSDRVMNAVAMVNEIAEAVAATIEVTPSIIKGEGEVVIRLKPTLLDGSEIRLTSNDGTLTLEIVTATPKSAAVVSANIPQLERALAEHVPAFRSFSIAVKKGANDETN